MQYLISQYVYGSCSMPVLVKRKYDPNCVLDEEDQKDIAEAKEDIREGRVYTTEQVRKKLGLE